MLSCVVHRSSLIARWRATLALALLWLSASTVNAQYRFDIWTTENGLPQNSVNAILQTRDGYLWIATNDGLVRYDGVRFTLFNRGNTKGIESNRCSALYEDRQGNLWIGTAEHRLTQYRDGTFITYAIKEVAPFPDMEKIEEDAEGSLWIIALRKILRWKQGQTTVYDPADFRPGLRRDHDNGMGQSNLWWCQDAAGLHYLTKGRVVTYAGSDGLPGCHISFVTEDQYGTLWISTTDAGLLRLKDGRFTIYTVKDGLPSNRNPKAFGDRKGGLWLEQSQSLRRLKDGKLLGPPFQAQIIYEDREGTIWLGSSLGLAHAREMAVTTLIDKVMQRDHPNLNDWVYCILTDRAGRVWLGEWGGGVVRYRDGRFTHYVGGQEWKAMLSASKKSPHTNFVFEEGLFDGKVTSLYEDREGCLWIGTESGMSQFKDGKITRYSDQHGLSAVWGMYQDRAGQMWFATSQGLVRYANGTFTTYTMQDGLASNDATVLFEDHAGALWIGSHGGLTRYAGGHFTAWREKDGFANSQIRAIYEDRDSVLWIGTYDSGLYRFKDGRVTRYTTKEGLFNNGVFQILEDERGNFWMSSNLGIYRVRRQELIDFAEGKIRAVTSIAYSKQDGMPTAECNGGRQPAGWKMRDGKLWFPTMLGVAIVDPEAIPLNTVPPPVVIEECRLNQQLVDFRDGVRIEPGQENLEIHYTGLSFINPEQVRFRYKLVSLERGWLQWLTDKLQALWRKDGGAEAEWVDASHRRAAYFNYLSAGRYAFTVMAANSDGVWNEQGAGLKIVVAPPVWQTGWFLTLVSLSVVGLAFFGYRRRISRLRREYGMREELVRREYALREEFQRREQAAQEQAAGKLVTSLENDRQRMADDLHDDLGRSLSIIANRALHALSKLQDPGVTAEHLSEIAETASQVTDEIHQIVYDLYPIQLDRKGLSQTVADLVSEAAGSCAIVFTPQIDAIDDLLSKDARIHLYRIIQEGINNIIKHARATAASVTLRRETPGVRLVIQDNGQGFVADGAAVAASSGLGLSGMAKRARLIGAEYEIHSAPGQGTTITVTLLGEAQHDEK